MKLPKIRIRKSRGLQLPPISMSNHKHEKVHMFCEDCVKNIDGFYIEAGRFAVDLHIKCFLLGGLSRVNKMLEERWDFPKEDLK